MSVKATDILATFDQQQKPVNGKPKTEQPVSANDILATFDQTIKKKDGGTNSSDSSNGLQVNATSPSQLTLPSATKKTFNYFNLGGNQNKAEEYNYYNQNYKPPVQEKSTTELQLGEPVVASKKTIEHGVKPVNATNLPNVEDAINNTVNKYFGSTVRSKEQENKYKENTTQLVKEGKLIPVKNPDGSSSLVQGVGFLKSFNDAITQANNSSIENHFLTNATPDQAIQYLNYTKNNPELGIVKPSTEAPSGAGGNIGQFLGENALLLEKGTIGALAGAYSGLTGGSSIGTFSGTVQDMAESGYANALKNNYYALKNQDPNITDAEAYDKARKAALAGEALSIGQGVILSGEVLPETPKPNVSTNGVIDGIANSFTHAVKTAPKVLGSTAVASVGTDLFANAEGIKKDFDTIVSDASQSVKDMAVMHFGLWALTQPTAIPSYIRPQVENIVASAPRDKVAELYQNAEDAGQLPKGTTADVLGTLKNFDEQKKVVENLPISEDKKASITGKLVQRNKLIQENENLEKFGGNGFADKIKENNDAINLIDNDISNIYKADNPLQVERDSRTGEPAITPSENLNENEINVKEGGKSETETANEKINANGKSNIVQTNEEGNGQGQGQNVNNEGAANKNQEQLIETAPSFIGLSNPDAATKLLKEGYWSEDEYNNWLKLHNGTDEEKQKANDLIVSKKEEVKNATQEKATQEPIQETVGGSKPSTEVDKGSVGETQQEDKIKVGELLDKEVIYNGKKAELYQDGQTVVAKIKGEPREYELGNIDEIKDSPISDFGIEHQTSVVSVNDNGDILVRDKKYKNPNIDNPQKAIIRNDDGDIIGVKLTTETGKDRTFRGDIAEDLAYQIQLKDITKNNESRNEFEQFINSDEPTKTEIDDAGLSETTTKKATENNEKVQRTKATKKAVEPEPTNITSPLNTEQDATQNRIIQEDNLPEHQNGDERGQTTEASDSNSNVESGQEQPQQPQQEKISGGNNVGVSHASLTELSQKLGLKEPERGEFLPPEWYADRGRKLLANGASPDEVNNPQNELHDRISIARAILENLVKDADAIAKTKGVDSEEYRGAIEKLNDYANNVVKKLGTLAHRAFESLQGQRDIDTDSFTSVKRDLEDLTGKKASKEQETKIKQLTDDNQKLKQQAEEAEKKLVEETDKAFKEGVEEGKKSKTYSEKAKAVADKFRKLKQKPFTFKDENGNVIDIQKMGVGWNDLVELGAKAIEKTGEIADGIKEVLDKIKDAEWYAKLSANDKEKLEKQLLEHYTDEVEETPEAKTIRRLQKELENLQRGIVKQKGEKIEDTEEIKDLKEQIFEAKKQLGLISSRTSKLPEPKYGLKTVPEKEKISEEQKRINRLEKQLTDLEQGNVQQKAEKFPDTPAITALKDKIFEAKAKLGLVASKGKVNTPAYGLTETPESRNIRRMEKELDDLRNGIVKDKSEKRPLSEVEKDLQDKIFEEKQKLGLVKSKSVKSQEHQLEITKEEKKIAALEKEKEDLENGIVKQKNAAKDFNPTPEQKDKINQLTDEISDLKRNLGVLKSKQEKPLTEEEQKQQDEKELEDLQNKFLNKTDNKFTVDEAKDIWDYAKKNYLDKGVSYRDMISNVADDLGLSWRQVSDAFTTPKVKRISDEMWKKQADYRRNQTATKTWIENQDKSPVVKALKYIPDKLRGLAVFGHGGIFVGTHAGMTLFSPSMWDKTLPAFFRGWKYAYGNTANYERAMESLKNSDNYVIAQRAGLKNNPDRINAEEFQKSQQWLGKLGLAGERGFNAIKVLRQDLFDYHYNKLSAVEKADPESAKSIARLVNNATGATNLDIPQWLNEATFAGGMEASRWGKLLRNPAEAASTAVKAILTPEKATTAEKVFAKVWARRVGEQLATYATLLAVNTAIQKMVNPKNPVNWTDPTKGDWLLPKFGDISVNPTSGMLSVVHFIQSLISDSFRSKKERHGDTVLQADAKNTFGYLRGKLAPGYSTAVDLKTGTDFSGNTLPYNSDKPQAGRRQLTWLEYVEEKLPIPVAEAFTVTHQAAQDNGMPNPTFNNIMDGITSGAISFATGFRATENKEKNEAFSDTDKSKPNFKYFIDKGLELPNTQLSSETITNERDGTKKPISSYSEDIQKRYQEVHKEKLENVLGEVLRQKVVYVKTYKNEKNDSTTEVSLKPPTTGKYKAVLVDKLNQDEYEQVLHLAQTEATKRAKSKVFGGQ